jgi:hypothetical protein
VVEYSGPPALPAALSAELRRLTEIEKASLADIVVLTPFAKARSGVWAQPLPGQVQLTVTVPAGSQEVQWSTVHAFKGLERAVVILAEFERWTSRSLPLETLLYVACSRASHHLVVLLPQDAPRALKRLFAT